MSLYLKWLKLNWEMFGLNRHFIFFFVVILLDLIFFLVSRFFLLIDHIFFPGFRIVEVKKPIFIIGHPRSGTSFVHHLFAHTNKIAAFKMWHIFFPALTARVLFKPLIKSLIRKKPILFTEEAGHQFAFEKPEEEEFLFGYNLDTQFFLIGTLLGFDKDDYREFRFHDLQPKTRRIKSALLIKRCFQRQIYYTGKTQIFAQTHFSTHRIMTLLEVFPDAKFIYMDRSPHETLPSYFSLIYNFLDTFYGVNRFSSDQIYRFYDNRYRGSLDLYRYFFDLWHTGKVNTENVLILPYETIMKDLVHAFEQIITFTGIKASPELIGYVELQARKQRQYKRKHEVEQLAKFGIEENRIEKDFAFILVPDPFHVQDRKESEVSASI